MQSTTFRSKSMNIDMVTITWKSMGNMHQVNSGNTNLFWGSSYSKAKEIYENEVAKAKKMSLDVSDIEMIVK